jgi:hypothetical protein
VFNFPTVSRRSGQHRARLALRCVAVSVAAAFGLPAMAQEFTVRDIRVEGIQRTEAGTVFSYLPVRVGDRYDPERGIAAIRALYATVLFKDVRLEVDGDVLGEYAYSDTGLVGEGTVPEEYKTQIGDFLIAYMPILAEQTT